MVTLKNIELEALHWHVYSNINKIIAMALIALCTDSKNRLHQTRPLHDSDSLASHSKALYEHFPSVESWNINVLIIICNKCLSGND